MKLKALLAVRRASGTLMFAIAMSPALAQVATTNADVVRKAILEVPLWHVDRSNGTLLWHFEMRGDKLWAKSINNDGKSIPDVQVEVINDGLKWIDSGGQQVILLYGPQDIQFPFKGTDSQGGTFEFTPK